jgi:hypothetical protein
MGGVSVIRSRAMDDSCVNAQEINLSFRAEGRTPAGARRSRQMGNDSRSSARSLFSYLVRPLNVENRPV